MILRWLNTLGRYLARDLHYCTARLAQLAYPTKADLPPYPHREGKWARFEQRGHRYGEPCWRVLSQRGGFEMGWIEWSPQWAAYRFKPASDAIFNGGLIAEIYAFLKERGQITGRFV